MTITSPIVTQIVIHENENSSKTNICTNNAISDEDIFSDNWLIMLTGWFLHNIGIRRVEG
jgi:hypothetical protein